MLLLQQTGRRSDYEIRCGTVELRAVHAVCSQPPTAAAIILGVISFVLVHVSLLEKIAAWGAVNQRGCKEKVSTP